MGCAFYRPDLVVRGSLSEIENYRIIECVRRKREREVEQYELVNDGIINHLQL